MNHSTAIEGTAYAMTDTNSIPETYTFAAYTTTPRGYAPARTDPDPSQGRFADPDTGRADPERIRRWLAEEPRLARYMTSSSTDAASGPINGVQRLDAVLTGLVDMFRRDGEGGLAGDLRLADQYIQALHVQIDTLGNPNLMAVPLVITHPIPLGRAVIGRTAAVPR